ncbi:hypothetical protein ANN_04076 [Periplaneta americana]|uniref:Uncharacterized protein n=1 Tax=Periplaneta americana TaxID=6978 RepID=A0ABQ8T9F6_PERAM|nr:hypothetical protein ANN_04076 [Periplaneta americana]
MTASILPAVLFLISLQRDVIDATGPPLNVSKRYTFGPIVFAPPPKKKDMHKHTWTSPDGFTHNQIDHILIDKRRHTSIVDIRTFRGAECNSDHYLVIGELRERLSVGKRVEQQVNITKFNILKLKDEEAKQNYQVEISNRFATLESSDEVEKELDVNSVWENIRDSIKIAAEQSIGYYETKKKKPCFDEDCCMVVERRKQAKLKFLQDPVEEKRDNYFNERREASRTLMNKKRGYLKEKLNEVETNNKNKNIRDLYKGINEFKNGYQPRVNVIKDENGDLLADSPSILNRWKNYFAQLLNVHRPNRNDRDEIEIQTAEPFIPEPTLSEVEIAIENLKKYKSPGIDQIPAELIQEGGSALYSEIYKLVLAIWEKEIVPEQWKESIIVPIFKKGDKTNCGNFRGISLLLTSYKMLSNILLRRLAPKELRHPSYYRGASRSRWGKSGCDVGKQTVPVRKYDSILKALSSLENANIFLERTIPRKILGIKQHNIIRSLLAAAFRNKGLEVYEEVHCLANQDRIRRIDIIASSPKHDLRILIRRKKNTRVNNTLLHTGRETSGAPIRLNVAVTGWYGLPTVGNNCTIGIKSIYRLVRFANGFYIIPSTTLQFLHYSILFPKHRLLTYEGCWDAVVTCSKPWYSANLSVVSRCPESIRDEQQFKRVGL